MSNTVLVGRNVAFAVDQYDVGGDHNEFKFKRDSQVVDATGFGARIAYDLAGIQKASLEMKGFFKPGYDKLDQIVNYRFSQDDDVLTLLAPAGWTLLDPAVMMPSVITKYDVTAKLKGAVDIDSVYSARGAIDDGFILLSPNNFLAGASGAGAVLDNTDNVGASTGGWAAQLHVLECSGTTPSLVFKLQESDDGTAWTDLAGGTFTTVTAASSERLVAGQGVAVKSQVRATWTNSGSDNIVKVVLGFSRSVSYS